MDTDLHRRLRELDPKRQAAFARLVAERGEEYGVHPLSSAQRRLWLVAELHPGTAAYNVPYAFRISGPLDPAALGSALRDVVRRHEALRTVFVPLDGEPWQLVLPEPDIALRVTDHSGVADDRWETVAVQHTTAAAARPFDLSAGPPVRAELLRFGPTDTVFLLTLHHIVCDGWSMRIIFEELAQRYAVHTGRVAEATAVEAAPTVQYADYARWQSTRLTGEVRDRLLAYWTGQLAGAPPVLELPTDRPRPAVPELKGAIEWFSWPAELADAVRGYAARESVTPFAVLLAALAALLHRYTGQDDVVIGSPVANRTRVETEGVVGFFVNMLALRTRPAADVSFRALVRQVLRTVVDGQAHQELPLEVLVDALRLERNAAYHPLFQVVGVLHDGDDTLDLPGMWVSPLRCHGGTAKFDLTVSFTLRPDELTGWLEYDRSLFDAETVHSLLAHLRRLLASALSDPDCPIETLTMLTPDEHRQLLYDWNRTVLELPGVRLGHRLVEEQVDATPDAYAVACGADRLTYRELDLAANRLAHELVGRGVRPGSLVGILLDRGTDLAVCALAVWKAGGAYLPLDVGNPPDRLRYMVEDAAVDLVLTDTGLVDRLPAGTATLCLDAARADLDAGSDAGSAAGFDTAPDTRPARDVHPDDLAYVIYTSGSTGRPKGVMIPHDGVCNLAAALSGVVAARAGDRILQFASFSFDASVFDVLVALTSGAELVFAPRPALQPGPDLAATIRAAGITTVLLPPTAAALMEPADVPTLRTVVLGGEACPPNLAATWSQAGTLFNAYGPTEVSVITTMARCLGWEHRVPIGDPLPNVEAYILDRSMQPVPRGVPGELYIGGRGLARGYLRRPELTAERFVPDPFGDRPGGRLYRSGDIVRYRLDGQLEFLGRADGQVKIRGLRIEMGEIQAVLAGQPGVRASVVTTREYGPGDVRLVAYLVADAGAQLDPAALRRALREALPEYMVPARLITVDAIPQTPTGKVDYAALDAHAHAGVSTQVAPATGRPGAPPRTDLERRIATVWRDVLGADDVDVHDNFFDLGGNSLLISRVRAQLERELGQPVATLTLFRYPTVHDLATELSGGAADRQAPPDRARQRADGRRALHERSRRRAARTNGEEA